MTSSSSATTHLRLSLRTGGERCQKGTFSVGVFGATNSFDNHTILGTNLENGTNDQVSVRADVSLKLSRTVQVESGVLVAHVDERQQRNRLITSTTTSSVNDYRGHATRQGGYARARVSLGRLQVLPGARIDYWQLTNQTASTRHGFRPSLLWQPAWSSGPPEDLYQQFPDFDEVVGAFAGTGLRPERSIHTDVGIEQRLTPSTRLQLTFYNRKDDEVIRRPGADTRLEAGRTWSEDQSPPPIRIASKGTRMGSSFSFSGARRPGFRAGFRMRMGAIATKTRSPGSGPWEISINATRSTPTVSTGYRGGSQSARSIAWGRIFRFLAITPSRVRNTSSATGATSSGCPRTRARSAGRSEPSTGPVND